MKMPITDGPDLFAIFANLATPNYEDGNVVDARLYFKGKLRTVDVTVSVRVMKIEKEDGSGHLWNLTGFVLADANTQAGPCTMFYDSKRRIGHVSYEAY